ncbi:DUF2867 domain-containing protein [Chitinophaga nivalis]|uniref:DUF2867 domain-containing protein n=1 Tax=Chitinophaga nivalis TaxID=2991709 RepID=A0ABT3IV63_9BACT|nr:DUF2867 domain-containing protein [Chitinophaga nivalis]MCW3462417.1 DUF2867 domain-containing protein [Chitinophaga nivalis]MCW3487892.1 DUF2867 domain-containing protein [Chitinophaga nivalis]
MRISKTTLPDSSLLKQAGQRIDYQDGFSTIITATPPVTIEQTGNAFFSYSPRWVNGMMTVRDKLVGLFGLKTTGNGPRQITITPGAQAGVFKIMDKTEQELIIGQDDKHLDFRVSLLLQQQTPAAQQLTCTTVVYYHNIWGRIYFIFVKPFHRLIVPAMLKNIQQHLHG